MHTQVHDIQEITEWIVCMCGCVRINLQYRIELGAEGMQTVHRSMQHWCTELTSIVITLTCHAPNATTAKPKATAAPAVTFAASTSSSPHSNNTSASILPPSRGYAGRQRLNTIKITFSCRQNRNCAWHACCTKLILKHSLIRFYAMLSMQRPDQGRKQMHPKTVTK